MPKLPSIDPIAGNMSAQIERAAQASYTELLRLIDGGTDPREAVRLVLETFNGDYVTALADAFSLVMQTAILPPLVLTMPVGDVKLAKHLYRYSARVQKEVAAIVKQHAQGLHDARKLAGLLYDGYSPAGGIKRPLEGAARAYLPKALRELTKNAGDRQELTRLYDEMQRQAARLKSGPLKAAYLEALDKWAKGKGADVLAKRLWVAEREKTRYMADRIAQTELAKAYTERVAYGIMRDDEIEVVQLRLSPAHPAPDICFRAGTKILTLNGLVPIEDVRVGDFVMTHLGSWRPVVRLYRSRLERGGHLVDLSAINQLGASLRVMMTPNHPVLTPAGWIRAGDLKMGSPVMAFSFEPSHCHQSADGEIYKEPLNSLENLPNLVMQSIYEPVHDELQDCRCCRISRIYCQCFLAPKSSHKTESHTCQHRLRPLSNSGSYPASLIQTGGSEIPQNAETCRDDASQSLDYFRPSCCSRLSKTSSLAQQEQNACHRLGIHEFCTLSSSISEQETVSRTRNCICGKFFGSCCKSYIKNWMISSINNVFSDGETVFNLEVLEHNSYVANGLVVHNCDLHARTDAYGLGAGMYPKGAAPMPPFHPHCFCKLSTRPELDVAGAKLRPDGVREYLRGLPPAEAARILGNRERLDAVLNGADWEGVTQASIAPEHRLRRVSDAKPSADWMAGA